MNLRKKITGVFAASALIVSMTSGIAFAQAGPEDDAYLDVNCPVTPSVAVEVNDRFSVDATGPVSGTNLLGQPYHNSDKIDNVVVMKVDLTCSWSTNWDVEATIGTFHFQGSSVPTNTQASFPGYRLFLTGGDFHGLGYEGPSFPVDLIDGVPGAAAPKIESNLFGGPGDDQDTAITNGERGVWFFTYPAASPGVTTAAWDGQLKNLPVNLAHGEYKATLDVVLSVD